MNELLKDLLENLTNTNSKDKVDVYDLTTKEGHDKAVEAIEVGLNNPFVSAFFGENFLSNLIDSIDRIYDEANEPEEQKQEIVQPSSLLTEDERGKIDKIVDEYVDTVIQPLGNFEDKILNDIKGSLTEFAAWIFKR
ncbi:MAG: hypothetical protein J6D03_10525 [Clostridia bacterium]|nr:hypothetical protein [Clostridia bacterium]